MSSINQNSAAAIVAATRATAVNRLMAVAAAQLNAFAISLTKEQQVKAAQAKHEAVAAALKATRAAKLREYDALLAARSDGHVISRQKVEPTKVGLSNAAKTNNYTAARHAAVSAANVQRRNIRFAAKPLAAYTGKLNPAPRSRSILKKNLAVGPKRDVRRVAVTRKRTARHTPRKGFPAGVLHCACAKLSHAMRTITTKRLQAKAPQLSPLHKLAMANVGAGMFALPAVVVTVETHERLAPVECLVDCGGKTNSINLHYLNSLRPHHIRSYRKQGSSNIEFVCLNVGVNFDVTKPIVLRTIELQVCDYGEQGRAIVLGASWVADHMA